MKSSLKSFAFAATVGASTLLTPASADAQGQSMCAQRHSVISMLEDRYGEELQGFGLANETRTIEVWANKNTGTWTILMAMSNGMACLVASGRHYEDTSNDTIPEGDPTNFVPHQLQAPRPSSPSPL
jgi:hypothetical protein